DVITRMNTSYLIGTDGSVWSTGSNKSAALGLNISDEFISVFSKLEINEEQKKLSCTQEQGSSLGNDGSYWTWGSNAEGQAGNNTQNSNYPSPIKSTLSHKWKSVVGGNLHLLGIKDNGSLWAWGSNARTQLGNGDPLHQMKPEPVQVGTDTDWKMAAGGAWQSIALKNDGTLWGWGDNAFGQLGMGEDADFEITTPTRIGADNDWEYVFLGHHHALAIKKDGSLWGWGNNMGNKINSSPMLSIKTPTKMSDKKWAMAVGGFEHTLAIAQDGTLWGIGKNDEGQLGLGDTELRTELTQIGNKSDWVRVSAGKRHSFAINKNGELYAFGDNEFGQLGVSGNDLLNPTLITVNFSSISNLSNNTSGLRVIVLDKSNIKIVLPETVESIKEIAIYTITGKLIQKIKTNSETISINEMLKGAYILQVITDKNVQLSTSFMK
ncbi:MAG: T9SS type A sorting domain-containing protein, partial [Gallicola sp.]|nr:T9SS type A sorting domain-containing protein [Gallicola sp.]